MWDISILPININIDDADGASGVVEPSEPYCLMSTTAPSDVGQLTSVSSDKEGEW
jgi:hypothetical protein